MFSILNRKFTEKYFHFQFVEYLIFFVFGILLAKHTFPLVTVAILFVMSMYVYFIHRIAHNIPEKLNVHTLFHHSKLAETSYAFNFTVETVVNIMFFVVFYWIKNFFRLNFIENSLIVYFCIVYTSVHMINYSVFHAGFNHAKHHGANDNVCNYGPDIMDHIFQTNCDNKLENMRHIIINVLIAYFITSGIFKIPIV